MTNRSFGTPSDALGCPQAGAAPRPESEGPMREVLIRCPAFALALLVVASGCENPKPAVPTPRAKTVADVVRDVQPSIVLIRVGGPRVNPSTQPMNEPVIAGTGFVVDARGYIATNDHVVAGAPDWPSPALEVHFADGK